MAYCEDCIRAIISREGFIPTVEREASSLVHEKCTLCGVVFEDSDKIVEIISDTITHEK